MGDRQRTLDMETAHNHVRWRLRVASALANVAYIYMSHAAGRRCLFDCWSLRATLHSQPQPCLGRRVVVVGGIVDLCCHIPGVRLGYVRPSIGVEMVTYV
jgi:hypothetical protein